MTDNEWRPVTLALDAAGLTCSVAVAMGDAIGHFERVEGAHGRAESLLDIVDRALSRAGLQPAVLNLIAVTVGPGSFTGIRIGLAAAKGIALATGAPLVAVTSFDATAVAFARRDRFLLVALESRREEVYVQLFDPLCDPVSDPAAMPAPALQDAVNAIIGPMPLLVVGDAALRAGESLAERADTAIVEASAPDAIGAFRAALVRSRRGEQDRAARPLYINPAAVTLRSQHRKTQIARA